MVTFEDVRRAFDGYEPRRVDDAGSPRAAVALILRAAPDAASENTEGRIQGHGGREPPAQERRPNSLRASRELQGHGGREPPAQERRLNSLRAPRKLQGHGGREPPAQERRPNSLRAPRLEALFIRRAEHPRDPWSGHIGLPGGRAESHDADATATAVRETLEETGLDLAAAGEFLGALDELRAMARLRARDLVIQPFVFALRARAEATASDEVAAVHWLPLDDLLAPDARGLMDYEWQGATVQFPCLRLHGLVIWGLTLRMLTGFAERVIETA